MSCRKQIHAEKTISKGVTSPLSLGCYGQSLVHSSMNMEPSGLVLREN